MSIPSSVKCKILQRNKPPVIKTFWAILLSILFTFSTCCSFYLHSFTFSLPGHSSFWHQTDVVSLWVKVLSIVAETSSVSENEEDNNKKNISKRSFSFAAFPASEFDLFSNQFSLYRGIRIGIKAKILQCLYIRYACLKIEC